LGQYVYSSSETALYVHQYVGSAAGAKVAGAELTLTAKTEYPWDGTIDFSLKIDKPAKFDLMLRIPSWCRKHKLSVNGKAFKAPLAKGYARLRRAWQSGDRVQLVLDMPIERVTAHPEDAEASGKVAFQRGPILYCLEQADNAAPVGGVLLPSKAKLTARFDKKTLGGVVVLEGAAVVPDAKAWKTGLYQNATKAKLKNVKIKAIPYALWDNRAPGAMVVWLPQA
jgi:hypothetical protein